MADFEPTWCTCPATRNRVAHAVEVTPTCRKYDATRPQLVLDKPRKGQAAGTLDERQLFWLQSYADGRSVADIAAAMSLHPTSVRNIPRRIQVLWQTKSMAPAHLVAEAFRRGVLS